jgi:hypothetical protein
VSTAGLKPLLKDKNSCIPFDGLDKAADSSQYSLCFLSHDLLDHWLVRLVSPCLDQLAHAIQRHPDRAYIVSAPDTYTSMSQHDGGHVPSNDRNNTDRKGSSHSQLPASPQNRDATPERDGQAEKRFQTWKNRERNVDSKASYKTGSAAFIEIPVDGKPVMALLLSYQLGQRMLKCVRLQRTHGELEDRSKIEITRIDKEVSDLQRLIDCSKSTIAKIELSMNTSGKEQLYKQLSEREEYVIRLQEEKETIKHNEKKLREQWYNYMEAVSLGYDEAFIKAGILPDYAKDENEGSPGTQSPSEEGADASKEKGENAHITSTKEKPGAEADDVQGMAPATYTVTRKETSTSTGLVPYDKSIKVTASQFLKEAEIRGKLLAAQTTLLLADEAHESHRQRYEHELTEFTKDNATLPAGELSTTFGPIFLKCGQKLICDLRDAERAYEKAEKCALDANIFLLPDALIDQDVNPYLDIDELDALYINRNNDDIIKWGPVHSCMLPPQSVYTIDTFDDASSSDDDSILGNVAIPQDDRPSRVEDEHSAVSSPNTSPKRGTIRDEPANENPESRAANETTAKERPRSSEPLKSHHSDATPDQEVISNSVNSSTARKRRWWGEVKGYDSYSVRLQGGKRQRIDDWTRECARWRAKSLPLK